MKKINVHTLIKIGYELQEMFPAMEFKFVISIIDELDYEWYTEEEVLNLLYEYADENCNNGHFSRWTSWGSHLVHCLERMIEVYKCMGF